MPKLLGLAAIAVALLTGATAQTTVKDEPTRSPVKEPTGSPTTAPKVEPPIEVEPTRSPTTRSPTIRRDDPAPRPVSSTGSAPRPVSSSTGAHPPRPGSSTAERPAPVWCDLAKIPVCTVDQKPTLSSTSNCPSCVVPRCTLEPKDIPACKEGEIPTRNVLTSCPTCKVPLCTEEAFKALPVCTQDSLGRFVASEPRVPGQCPSCRVPKCSEDAMKQILPCKSGESPAIQSNGCLSCKPAACTKPPSEIPACTDKEPTLTASGCPSCRFPTCKFSELPLCTGDNRNQEGVEGCPSCRPSRTGSECTTEPSQWRTCLPDEDPQRDETSNCPSCKRVPPPECDLRSRPRCAADAQPEKDAKGCPTCFPGNGRPEAPKCTAEALKKCAQSLAAIPECGETEKPQRDPDSCCMSCVPPKPACDDAAKARCKALYPSLAVCPDKAAAELSWDPTTCCFSCRRPDPKPEEKPDAAGKCTKEAVEACLANVPVCDDATEPAAEPVEDAEKKKRCCPRCKRPERTCKVEAVALCLKDAPVCAAGERPAFLQNECCVSCKPAPPVCGNCTATQVCARDGTAGKCVAAKRVKAELKIADAARKAQLAGLAPAQVADLLKEIIQRFCDKPENAERCAALKQRALDTLKVPTAPTAGATADSPVVIEIDSTETVDPAARRRRLLADLGTPSQLVVDALNDPSTTDGFTASVAAGGSGGGGGGGGSSPGALSSASTAAPALLAGLVAAVAFVLRA